MNMKNEDALIRRDDTTTGFGSVGVVEVAWSKEVQVKLPEKGNQRTTWNRAEVRHVAELIAETLREGGAKWRGLDLTGKSTLGNLLRAFGQPFLKIREINLGEVRNQLKRAGVFLKIDENHKRFDDEFSVELASSAKRAEQDEPEPVDGLAAAPSERVAEPTSIGIPIPFWPVALGLERPQEITFLKALVDAEPILCILRLDEDPNVDPAPIMRKLPLVWQGLVTWARTAARRFTYDGFGDTGVIVLADSVKDAVDLDPGHVTTCLLQIDGSGNLDSDVAGLRAGWPGSTFVFAPKFKDADARAIYRLLAMVGGVPDLEDTEEPLGMDLVKMMAWSRENSANILASSWSRLAGTVKRLKDKTKKSLRGSSEASLALDLKILLEHWLLQTDSSDKVEFEVKDAGSDGEELRIDVRSHNREEDFEVESLRSSGPFEAFFAKKVMARIENKDRNWSLVIPADALLWAGPVLADLAASIQQDSEFERRILIPCNDGFFRVAGSLHDVPEMNRPSAAGFQITEPKNRQDAPVAGIKMEDIGGYQFLRDLITHDILPLWDKRDAFPSAKVSGYVFFGPPGCGKTRIAKAIAGELGREEFRIIGPSDFTSKWVGEGLEKLRGHFDWLMENPRRSLFIDEVDAVAKSRSKYQDQMISDEMAKVNELLVRVEQALDRKRLVIAATNFVGSLDEAFVRSGRMGTFIPVPPPTVEDGVAIVEYHLKKTQPENAGPWPGTDEIRAVLESSWAIRDDRSMLASADLEAMVNRARFLSFRHDQQLNASHLRTGLERTSRSVKLDHLEQFKKDILAYCSPWMIDEFQRTSWWASIPSLEDGGK